MPETLPVAPAGAGASPDRTRESRIEELLLAGLDHYFAGKYEDAITLWTRVAFLERGHGRARAYIERARGALAERQREGDELLHRGITAYQSGDMNTARTLLSRAVDFGGPADVALAFLQRLNRFETAAEAARSRTGAGSRRRVEGREPAQTRWLPTLVVSAVTAVTIVLLALPVSSWIAELPISVPSPAPARAEPLPIVRTSEVLIARARTLSEAGRLKDALALLERISRTDPLRPDADRLRARVQREALAAAGLIAAKDSGR